MCLTIAYRGVSFTLVLLVWSMVASHRGVCRLHDRLSKCMTAYAEHGLMYEDARQHQRAAYYYKLAVMTSTHHPEAATTESVDSLLIGIAEAYDGAWQDSGLHQGFAGHSSACICTSCPLHDIAASLACLHYD